MGHQQDPQQIYNSKVVQRNEIEARIGTELELANDKKDLKRLLDELKDLIDLL